ncbi:MAG TPA: hypothetical protein VIK04_01525 [Solirubrobacteraceae bacterium]
MDGHGVRLTARVLGAGIGVWVGAAVASAQAAAPVTAPPQLLSLAYGRLVQRGVPAPGLRLTAREPHGQLVEIAFQEIHQGIAGGVGGVLGERCGSHRRRNGRVEVSYAPLGQPLSRGTHQIRVVAYGSRCTRGSRAASSARTFTVHVRR